MKPTHKIIKMLLKDVRELERQYCSNRRMTPRDLKQLFNYSVQCANEANIKNVDEKAIYESIVNGTAQALYYEMEAAFWSSVTERHDTKCIRCGDGGCPMCEPHRFI